MAAPDVQGLDSWVVTENHLIRGDRMSLYGENIGDATSLVIGGHSCAILDPTTSPGYDTISFIVPATLRPNRPDGTVSVTVTNPDGTWISNDLVWFKVARTDEWVQPDDVESTNPVTSVRRYFNFVDEDTDEGTVLADFTVGLIRATGGTAADAYLGFESVYGSPGLERWHAEGDVKLWTLFDPNWTRHRPSPSIPDGALGWETEPQSIQDWTATGTINYPATIELRVKDTAVAAEKQTGSTAPWVDNSDVDPASGWNTGGTAIEVRAGNPIRETADPVPIAAFAAADLLASAPIEPLVTADSPDRRLTFTFAETDLETSRSSSVLHYAFVVLLDRLASETWYGFPPTPPDSSYPTYRRRVQANIDTVTATATYTPPRYRFVYEISGGVTPLRQRQTSTGIHTAGTPLRQRQHYFGLRQRQTGI